MAVLSAANLTELRQGYCASVNAAALTVAETKPILNAALQAVEDWFESAATKAAASAAIDAATTPTVLSNAKKKRLVAYYLRLKFGLESV